MSTEHELPEYEGPIEIIEEARRCPTCESLHHRECDEEALRADDPPNGGLPNAK